jgi:multidrug efflux pump subunit AcrA (membrane-fusion protein)
MWILREGETELTGLSVKVGQSDGQMTEIQGDDLKPGMQVVVDMVKEEKYER